MMVILVPPPVFPGSQNEIKVEGILGSEAVTFPKHPYRPILKVCCRILKGPKPPQCSRVSGVGTWGILRIPATKIGV